MKGKRMASVAEGVYGGGDESEPEREREYENESGRVGRAMIPVFMQGGRMVSDQHILETKHLLRVDEAADILRVSRRTVFELCIGKELECVKLRRSMRIKSASVRKLIDRKE